MDGFPLIAILAIGTLLVVVVAGFMSKRKTEERLHDENAQKSTLAADAPDTHADNK